VVLRRWLGKKMLRGWKGKDKEGGLMLNAEGPFQLSVSDFYQ